jgi:hypothetical protein
MNEFKNIDFLKQQALMTSKLSRIDIYIGDVSPLNIKGAEKVQEMRPFAPGEWGDQFEFFKNNCHGTFTAFLFPSKVKVKIQNFRAGELPETLNGTENMQNYGIPTEQQVQAQVQKILENERLKMRLEQLEDEAEDNNVWGQRLGVALNMVLDRFVPGSSQTMQAEPVLNGTELNTTEAALVVLVENFGEEWLQKFAAKVANDPKIVPQIKAFFS